MKKLFPFLLIFTLILSFDSNVNAVVLSDVSGHPYEDAIRYLESNKIIAGYPDGTYKPENSVNRAEFTKIIVEASLGSNPTASAANCFPDVKVSDWFAGYVCYAKENNLIAGYPNGNFEPANTINLAEASKIMVNTLGLNKGAVTQLWYQVYIQALQENAYIPSSFSGIDNVVNRAQMAEMIWRILENISSKPAKTFPFESDQTSTPVSQPGNENSCLDSNIPLNVNMNEVRQSWLTWHNEARIARGESALTMNEGLDYTSVSWAKENENLSELTHDRSGGQSASDWFTSNQIVFKALNGYQFGENVGLRSYDCTDLDCTDEMIEAVKFIFDAFMAEEGTSYTGHYDNIMQSDFKELGFGLAIDTNAEVVYLASHYAQGVESYPDTCQ